MASTSKTKKQWQVNQQKRNWLDLPSDVTANILQRVGVSNILENAQKVCISWRKICKDPAMWRVIHMDKISYSNERPSLREMSKLVEMCKHAVNRSQGQLVEISIAHFATAELIQYIANRSVHLKCLKIASCYDYMRSWTNSLEKFPYLEELSLYKTHLTKEAIETVGRCCPKLKTLKMSQEAWRLLDSYTDEVFVRKQTENAIAIGENLRELRHLELIGNRLTNIGLKAILDNCSHLESLDLRQCIYIDLKGDLGKRCCEQIRCVKFPNESLEGCPYDRFMVCGEYMGCHDYYSAKRKYLASLKEDAWDYSLI